MVFFLFFRVYIVIALSTQFLFFDFFHIPAVSFLFFLASLGNLRSLLKHRLDTSLSIFYSLKVPLPFLIA